MSTNPVWWELRRLRGFTFTWAAVPPEPPDFSVWAGVICVIGLSAYILIKEFWQ